MIIEHIIIHNNITNGLGQCNMCPQENNGVYLSLHVPHLLKVADMPMGEHKADGEWLSWVLEFYFVL